MSTLNLAIVGLGRLGKRHALNLHQQVPQARLIAACSPVAEELDWARANLGADIMCTDDYAAILRHPEVNAVVLVTPTSLHAEQIIAAIDAGKHVFCEKPLALNLEDCLKVEQAAAAHPELKVMIGFVRRFDPSYYEAWQAIQDRTIGEPFFVRSQTCDQLDPSGGFVRFSPTSGGIFMDCSIHDIDLARWLLGNPKPVRVYASGVNSHHPELAQFADVDNGIAVVEFENGKMAQFYTSRTFAHGHDTHTEIIATRGNLHIGLGAHSSRVQYATANGIGHHTTPDFYERFKEAFLLELNDFVDCVIHDRPLRLQLSDATQAARIGLGITAAFRTQQLYEFD